MVLFESVVVRRVVAALCGLLLSLAACAAHAAAVVVTGQVRAELVAHAPLGLAPGQTAWLGLKIEHRPHWHTYWKNPGDSGLPTTLKWTLPKGVSAGEIEWPTPRKLPIGPMINHGYEGTLLLAVPLSIDAGFTGHSLPVKLRADWLVCKDVCIPEGGDFDTVLPLASAIAGHAALFETTRKALPQASAQLKAQARVDGDFIAVSLQGLPARWHGLPLDLYTEQAEVLAHAARPAATWLEGRWQVRWPLSAERGVQPQSLDFVITRAGQEAAGKEAGLPSSPHSTAAPPELSGPSQQQEAYRVTAALQGRWGAPLPDLPAMPAANEGTAPAGQAAGAPLQAALEATSGADISSLLATLALALLGGALLNLMPCVFPVLSLKVLGFARHAAGHAEPHAARHAIDRRGLAIGGLAYSVGVIASFLLLAALLLALRAAGDQIGWGFQLQSPFVVAALALLFTLIGLNLAGVFEMAMIVPSAWASAQARHPVLDHALTGVLAVAVASPCTAPFMGASLGAAFTMPPAQALLVFAALGLGMALPYLLISLWPGLALRLPRPGPWMAHLKTALAFPMWVTVVWLLWVLGQQVGLDGALAFLLMLVAVAFFAWALGQQGLGPRAAWVWRGLAVASLVLSAAWAWPLLRAEPASETASDATAMDRPQSRPGEPSGWQPWSVSKVSALQARGQAAFVDFTAAWCVTCQVNKRSTLSKTEVLQAFDRKGVVLLRADWTRRDPEISQELARLGRSGVPVYALYLPGQLKPVLLPELLSAPAVLEVLERVKPDRP